MAAGLPRMAESAVFILCLFAVLTAAQPADQQMYDKVAGQQCGGCFSETECVDAQWPNARCPAGTSCARKDQWFWFCAVDSASDTAPAAAPAQQPAPADAAEQPADATQEAAAPPADAPGTKQAGEQCGGCISETDCPDKQWPGVVCASGLACSRNDQWWWFCEAGAVAPAAAAPAVAPKQQQLQGRKQPGAQCGGCHSEDDCEDAQWADARCSPGYYCARKDQWWWFCAIKPAPPAPSTEASANPTTQQQQQQGKELQAGEQCGGCHSDGTCEDAKWQLARCAPGLFCSRKDQWWWSCQQSTATAFASAAKGQTILQQVGEQCGGCYADGTCQDAKWPAARCAPGLFCSRKNQWWWSCQQGIATASPSTAQEQSYLQQAGEQCGGCHSDGTCEDAKWPTARCAPGLFCSRKDQWWWSCQQSTATAFTSAAKGQPILQQVGEQCGGCYADGTCQDAKWPAVRCAPGLFCSRKDQWWWSCKQGIATASPSTAQEQSYLQQAGEQCGGCHSDGTCEDAKWHFARCAPGLFCSRKDQWWWSCQQSTATAFASAAKGQTILQQVWEQCGGCFADGTCQDAKWVDAKCAPDTYCTRKNEWWWFCKAGAGDSAAVAAEPAAPSAAPAKAPAVTKEKQLQDRKQPGEQCGGCHAEDDCIDAKWADARCAPGYYCARKDQWWWFCEVKPAPPPPPVPADAAEQPADATQEAAAPPADAPGTKQAGEQCGGCISETDCPDKQWPGVVCASGLACSRNDQWWWFCEPSADAPGVVSQQPQVLKQQAEQCGGCRAENDCEDAKWREARCAPGLICSRKNQSWWSCTPYSPPSLQMPLTPAAILAAQIAAAQSSGKLPPAAAPEAATKATIEGSCPDYVPTAKYRKTTYTDFVNTTVSISPNRPNPDREAGEWITGRATFYGTDKRVDAAHVACGEPEGQFGILAHGSCGYTDITPSGPKLSFPKELYAAAADANADFPGSCGRCYEIRCRSGVPQNNGRPIQISDLLYYRPYDIKDDAGRSWPGNPYLEDDLFFVKCWDDDKTIKIKIGDSCPCKYPIKYTGEIRTQHWCCGGNNHFDISYWAFQQLAHPSYGVMPLEYRPVACDTMKPLDPLPGFINTTIYYGGIQAGWGWRPYFAKDTVLRAPGQGYDGRPGTCATLSQNGAVSFFCRECAREGYQPFLRANYLFFSIRSNTKSDDPFASSTPPGKLPELKVFMMNDEGNTYCNKDVVLGSSLSQYYLEMDGWFHLALPLSLWECDKGSVGGLANVNRVDFQNTQLRDANICMDNIGIVDKPGTNTKRRKKRRKLLQSMFGF